MILSERRRSRPRPIIGVTAESLAGMRHDPIEEALQHPATSKALHDQIRTRVGEGRVLDALDAVDRALFLPDDEEIRQLAHLNVPIRLTEALAIPQPSMLAIMAQFLGLTGEEAVLEIGTGTGWGAAVLSRLARTVDTVESDPELTASAEGRLRNLGFGNVTVHPGDGLLGLPDRAPFGAILLTGSVQEVPQPLVDQLAVWGRMVVAKGPSIGQQLCRYTKRPDGTMEVMYGGPVKFIPLVSPSAATPK